MEKYILFGAGNYGKSALQYYGQDAVLCFADNNSSRVGKDYCGKKIISFEEMKERAGEYTLVICANAAEAIRKQFEGNGITDYRCYTPAYEHFLEYMKRKLCKEKMERIVLCGQDHNTDGIVEALETMGMKGRIVQQVSAPEEIQAEKTPDCIIVSAMTHHVALYARLRRQFVQSRVIDPYRQYAYYDTDDIIFNPYTAKEDVQSETEWNQAVADDDAKASVRAYVDVVKDQVPLFEYIEIETVNRCNGVCSFCPVNKKIDPRTSQKMNEKLFYRIIDQLGDLDYEGELSLFSNNEPLLDERIVQFHRYAREKLPKARIHMFTNGTLFTLPLFTELISYLDELVIDNYMQELKLIRPVEEIVRYVEEHPELRKKVTVVLRKPNEILTSRGGDAPNRKELVSYRTETCALPFEQMIIRPDGKVSLCCNDPLGKNTLGDVSVESLTEVWYGDGFQKARECIARGREQWEHCKFCDTFYLY